MAKIFMVKIPRTSWEVGFSEVSYFSFSNFGICDVGLPGGTSGKEPACQCRRHKRCRFDPWEGPLE